MESSVFDLNFADGDESDNFEDEKHSVCEANVSLDLETSVNSEEIGFTDEGVCNTSLCEIYFDDR